jgi:hypothetical protein
VFRQTQRSREDVDCDEDSLGRGEVKMEMDGEYSIEEENNYTKIGLMLGFKGGQFMYEHLV